MYLKSPLFYYYEISIMYQQPLIFILWYRMEWSFFFIKLLFRFYILAIIDKIKTMHQRIKENI